MPRLHEMADDVARELVYDIIAHAGAAARGMRVVPRAEVAQALPHLVARGVDDVIGGRAVRVIVLDDAGRACFVRVPCDRVSRLRGDVGIDSSLMIRVLPWSVVAGDAALHAARGDDWSWGFAVEAVAQEILGPLSWQYDAALARVCREARLAHGRG